MAPQHVYLLSKFRLTLDDRASGRVIVGLAVRNISFRIASIAAEVWVADRKRISSPLAQPREEVKVRAALNYAIRACIPSVLPHVSSQKKSVTCVCLHELARQLYMWKGVITVP